MTHGRTVSVNPSSSPLAPVASEVWLWDRGDMDKETARQQHLYCDRCGEPITVVFQPADLLGAYQPAKEQPWACPHGCGLTPMSPPRVKSADLLRPVVVRSPSVGSPSATAESKSDRVLVQCCLRFQRWRASKTRAQHLLRLSLRVAKGKSRRDSHGLETHSGPHTGLLMTRDVACARPLSPGSGEGQPYPVNACAWRKRERASHQSGSLPDLWLMIVGSWRSVRTRGHDQ